MEKNPLLFIKEVAKYFMDFLETDFHKHKFPRRSIKLRNNDNLLIGLNLQKYPSVSGDLKYKFPYTIFLGAFFCNNAVSPDYR